MNNQPTYNPFAQNEALIKNYFKRKSVLTMAILHCISILFVIATIFTMSSVFPELYGNMFTIADVPAQELDQMSSVFSSPAFTMIYSIVCSIPSIVITGLIATGYFMLYFKSKNEDPASSPKAGITILYILAIIQLVTTCLACLYLVLAILVFGIFAIVGYSNPSALDMTAQDASILSTAMLIVVIILAGMLALTLTYSISHLMYINSIKKSISSPKLYNKGAGAYGTMSIIYAVFSSFALIAGLMATLLMPSIFKAAGVNDPYITTMFTVMQPMYILSGLASVVSVVLCITDAVIARGYKKYINEITGGYTNPLYAEQLSDIEPMQLVCPQCGGAVKDSDVFCGICGATINRQ